MRRIIMAFILGTSFANSLLTGVDTISGGGSGWILWELVFPACALAGLVALLLDHRRHRSGAAVVRTAANENAES